MPLPNELEILKEPGETVEKETVKNQWKWYFNEMFNWHLVFDFEENFECLADPLEEYDDIHPLPSSLAKNLYEKSIALLITFVISSFKKLSSWKGAEYFQ